MLLSHRARSALKGAGLRLCPGIFSILAPSRSSTIKKPDRTSLSGLWPFRDLLWFRDSPSFEIESVFAIKVRTRQLDLAGQDLARRRFQADISQGRVRVGPPIEERHYQRAANC